MKLFSGTSNLALAEKTAEELDMALAEVEIIRFADGECRVRIEEDVKGAEVVFLQSTSIPADRYIMETLFFINSAQKLGAEKIILAVPYFGYARQDREHRKGEAVSASVVAGCLEKEGVDKLITFDIHSKQALSYFNTEVVHQSILPFLTKQIIDNYGLDKENLGIFSPDQDGAFRARDVVDEIGAGEYGFVQKERDLDKLHVIKEVHGKRFMGQPEGRDIILVDDIITSGRTILQAAQILKEENAGRVFAVAAHAAFMKDLPDRLGNKEVEAVYVSDSIPLNDGMRYQGLRVFSLASVIAGVIK